MTKICINCKKEFQRTRYPCGSLEANTEYQKRKFCSQDCTKSYLIGERHGRYIRGYRTRPDGYLRFTDDRYVHRAVMEEHLGRKLRPEEFIHHRNNDTSDNRIENLELTNNSEHRRNHCKSQPRGKNGVFACLKKQH